jgi:mono/diheme cytochrome c family protein/cytochrome c553
MRLGNAIFLGLIAALALPGWAAVISTDSSRADFFEKKIRPVLMDNCYKCHSPTAPKLKGGLSVATRDALLKGGEHGSAIVPGHPEKSKFIEAIRWTNKDLQMPPKTQLSAAQIADLTKWVQMGAPWGGGILKGPAGPTLANYDKLRQQHWAWQPVRPVTVPSVKNTNWPLGDVDKFVLAGLEASGLHPAAQANRYELLRRVTFDLTGLPPTLPEVEAFSVDESPDAYGKVVDRLLASPAFGERWGRHWLDVARYSESTGSTRNYPYEYAWRYRDYVIDSFNHDKPYNQFVTEQVAGDLLGYKSSRQHNDQLVATGFLAMGVKDLNEKDATKFMMDNVDEQIDTVGKAFLATTISCARCHDHKFDPIPQADYYKMAGIFRSTQILSGLQSRKGGGKKQASNDNLLVRLDPLRGSASDADAQAEKQEEISDLNEKLAEAQSKSGKAGKNASKGAKKTKFAGLANKAAVNNLKTELSAAQSGVGLAIGVREEAPSNSPIYQQGNVESPGPVVPRGMLTLCKYVSTSPIPSNQSGRLELARWIASRDNPLTSRVVVNRIWHHLFGQGLVRTVDNFGTTGEAPSNPRLLDYLAARFITADNWSFKKMIRELVLSRTYQMAGNWDSANGAIDPSDRLLWRMAPRRLEAEEIRDALLMAGGTLDEKRPIGSAVMGMSGEVRNINIPAIMQGSLRNARSVYLPVVRENLPIALDKFDFASPEMVTGDREVTTVAPQALYLMNDPFVIDQAKAMAGRILEHDWMDLPARVDVAYRIAFGRLATAAEKQRAVQYLTDYGLSAAGSKSTAATQQAWTSLSQALLASAEFRYVD